jgi:hypothetical protein
MKISRAIKQVILLIVYQLLQMQAYAQEYNYYYGNIHAHTSYSDGCKDEETTGVRTPAQAFAFAKQSEHLDFLGISEHNHSKAGMDLPNYHRGVEQAAQANEDGGFACIYGMEYGTVAQGHILIYGMPQLMNWETDNTDMHTRKGDYNQIWELLADCNHCFVTLAHPKQANFNDLLYEPYNEQADAIICGVAVRNGPHSSHSVNYDEPPSGSYYGYYKSLLAAGYKVGPTIDHDNHYTTFGRTSQGRTVILAKNLTQNEITAAYKAMRFYATDDWNTQVRYTINEQAMGSSLKKGEVELEVSVEDPDLDDAIETVKVMYGYVGSGEEAKTFIHETEPEFRYTIEILPGENLYFFLEITQRDKDKIITAPIWVKGNNVP